MNRRHRQIQGLGYGDASFITQIYDMGSQTQQEDHEKKTERKNDVFQGKHCEGGGVN